MKLAYQACDKSGKHVSDTIESPDVNSATEALRRKGLYVIEIEQAKAPSTGSSVRPLVKSGGARRLKDLAMFTRQLSVLVSSGTPLVEAFGALERQVKAGPWRDTISSIRRRLEEGTSLSEAMEANPEYFDPAYCGTIAAGESSGDLISMLDRLADLKQKRLRMRNLVVSAMIYPCLLAFMAAGVLVLLLTFVVPRFAVLFESLDVPLPPSTALLVVLSELFQSYWPAILAGLVVSILVLRNRLGTPGGRHLRDTIILRIPRIGSIAKSFTTARITRLLGVLLQGRVPVMDALRLTRNASANVHYKKLITRAEDLVSRGEPIYSAFSDTDLISPYVCEAIRNGERSGQIGPQLLHIADFLDDENETVLRSLTSIIEPVMLVILGLVVGVVAISLFMPLFDLTSMMQGGPG